MNILWSCSSDNRILSFIALGVARIEHGFEIYQKRIRRLSKEGKAHANEVIRDGGKKWTPGMSTSKKQELKRRWRRPCRGPLGRHGRASNRRQRKPNLHEGSSQVSHKMTGAGRWQSTGKESGDILQGFKLGNHITECGKTNGKWKLGHPWHLLGDEKKGQDGFAAGADARIKKMISLWVIWPSDS